MITVATKWKAFALWKKGYDKPRQRIKKQRHHFANNGLYSQSYAFSIWLTSMYGCESWPIKKAECQRTDAFKLWCWRRFFRVLWTARRSNQSILKEISPEYSTEGLMLKLQFQFFGHLMGKSDSLEKTLMLGKTEGTRRRGWQRTRWLDSITNSMNMNLSQLRAIAKDREAWCAEAHGVPECQTWPSNWTMTMIN